MLNVSATQSVNHQQMISALAQLRQEWQEATEGASLLETNGNIGLMLADLINGFGLNTEDQRQILGTELLHELKDFLYTPKQN